jgi:hypothetical protein
MYGNWTFDGNMNSLEKWTSGELFGFETYE